MTRIIGVRFRPAGKVYYFAPGKFHIKKGQQVIVETARGIEFGNVVIGPKEVEDPMTQSSECQEEPRRSYLRNKRIKFWNWIMWKTLLFITAVLTPPVCIIRIQHSKGEAYTGWI